jgi:hypothetical protein
VSPGSSGVDLRVAACHGVAAIIGSTRRLGGGVTTVVNECGEAAGDEQGPRGRSCRRRRRRSDGPTVKYVAAAQRGHALTRDWWRVRAVLLLYAM